MFIGQDLDVGAISRALDACLATEEEAALGPALPDPLLGSEPDDEKEVVHK